MAGLLECINWMVVLLPKHIGELARRAQIELQ